jgi:nucleotide-binding universal stress UspA family protein
MAITVTGTEGAKHAERPDLERILLATRWSFASLAAARWLLARARTRRLAVQVSVAPDASPTEDETTDPELVATDGAARRVREYLNLVEPEITTTVALLSADREADVLDAALETDLLVLATNGSAASGDHRSASFATRVALQAICATVVVPRAWVPADGPVVVGLGSRVGDYAALDRAAEEAEQQHRDLVVVHAAQPLAALTSPMTPDLDDELSSTIDRQCLDDAVDRVSSRHPDLPVRSVLASDGPMRALADEGRDAGLLVLGSPHSADGLQADSSAVPRALLDSPPCPVMMVPPAAQTEL